MRPTRPTLTALALGLLLTLTACSGSADLSADEREAPSAATDGSDASAGGATDGGATEDRAQPVADPGAPEAVIATATVSFHGEDLTAARREVQRITDRFRGQVADEETESERGEVAWTRMVLRIPTADFDAAIDALERVGELDATTRTTDVVTDKVRDNQARVRAQERSLRRLEALLDRAQGLDDIIRLETELGRRQADLDALKATGAWLADQTSMSTINVHAHRAAGPEPVEEDETRGFLTGLAAGWHGLSATAVVLATVLGAVLPWLPVLALVALPVWWTVRRRPRPPAAPTATGGAV